MGDEELLRKSVTSFSSKYGIYGYKRITALLNQDGWKVNHKRVFWIWRENRLKVPSKQPTHNLPPYQIFFKSLTFGLLCGGRVKSGINSGVWSV
jgi:transposase InsO family protein